MPSRLSTRSFCCTLLCFGLLGLSDANHAQVYKSYDEDGDVVFSDRPSKRSTEVEIGNPNLSDSFKAPPPTPGGVTRRAAEPKPESETKAPVTAEEPSADTNNDGRISRREKEAWREAQRKKRRAAKKAAEAEQ